MFHVFHRYTVSGCTINAFAYFASNVTLAQHKSVFMLMCRLTRETRLLCERNWIGQLIHGYSYVICAAAVFLTCSQQCVVDVLAVASLGTCSAAAAAEQIYSAKTKYINTVTWHYHANPSERCHDRNIYGRIDLLHCCCGRASTETCYCQYIHNTLLWACKKYYICMYVCRNTQHSLLLFSGASEVNAGLSGGIRAWLKRGVLVFLMYIHITEAPWAITARLHKP